MANEEIKLRIIDFFKQSKGKSKFYLSDLMKAAPELTKKDLKKVTTEMIAEGTLMYYSTGSTTMLQLAEEDVDAKLKEYQRINLLKIFWEWGRDRQVFSSLFPLYHKQNSNIPRYCSSSSRIPLQISKAPCIKTLLGLMRFFSLRN